MTTISIKITGTKETSETLKSITKELQNTSEPLDNSSRKYLNAISSNFSDEGKTFGQPWKPLSRATIAIKTALKKEGKAIEVEKPLVRTGLMRRSFGYDLNGKNQSSIYNTSGYALVHQDGGTVMYRGQQRRVPKRVLADVDDRRVQTVGMTFERWIYDTIHKYNAQ
jgi:phage gpG-like protein